MPLDTKDIRRSGSGSVNQSQVDANTQAIQEISNSENININADAAIGFESTNLKDGMHEVAEDIHDLNNMPDLTVLYENAIT